MSMQGQPSRTAATTLKSWWPGWIWAVPIAAAAITIWLLVRAISTHGTDVTVTFDDAAQMKANDTKVLYRGVTVGKVTSIELAKDRSHTVAHLDIDDSMKQALNTGTKFYLEGANPSLSDLSSLKSVIAGPTVEIVPGDGKPTRSFAGQDGNAPGRLAVAVPYVVRFSGDVGGLKPGAAVMFRGFVVGQVVRAELLVDAANGDVETPVIIALDPTRFHIRGGARGDSASAMNAIMAALVERGVRASLTQSPPLIGANQIVLKAMPDAQEAHLSSADGYTEIPAAEGGGVGELLAKAGQLPIEKIGNNILAITQQAKLLVSSPKLKDSVAQLDKSLIQLEATLREVRPQIAPTVASLRDAAKQIDATAQSARNVMGGSPAASSGNLKQALQELTQAARATRGLADYLDEHPEALIKGRSQ